MKLPLLLACSAALLVVGCSSSRANVRHIGPSVQKPAVTKEAPQKENLARKTTIQDPEDRELIMIIGGTPGFSGQPQKQEKKVVSNLLTNSPSFAEKNVHGAVKENMVKLPNTMPLFRQPLFAQLVVFPYISEDGVYHGYSESWLKVKDGNFVLSDPRKGPASKERIFEMNDMHNWRK